MTPTHIKLLLLQQHTRTESTALHLLFSSTDFKVKAMSPYVFIYLFWVDIVDLRLHL